MLRIRLQRTGRENIPTFRLVVADHARPVKGKYKEIIGYYLPQREPVVFECQHDRVSHWIRHGAAPTDTVARLLKRHGYKEQGIDLEKFIEPYTKKKKKGEQTTESPPSVSPPSGGSSPTNEANKPS